MKSYFLTLCVLFLATKAVNGIWCHTCIDYRPWPAFNLTAEERGPLSLCRRNAEPSFLFLRECESENDICAQIYAYGRIGINYIRYAQRACINSEDLEDFEMNACDGGVLDLRPALTIGPITIEACICDSDACNPVLNYTGNAVKTVDSKVLDIFNSMKPVANK